MTQDAFELLQEANPMPEDPPPLPIAPLLERVEQLPPLPPVGKGPDRRSKGRLTLIAVVAVAVGVLAFTRSTTHSPPGSSVAGVVVAPEVESIAAGRADPDEYLDLRQSSASVVSEAQVRQAPTPRHQQRGRSLGDHSAHVRPPGINPGRRMEFSAGTSRHRDLSPADHRNELNAARTSRAKISGSSHAAKWPPFSASLK